ncbi:hypothetical protein DFH29DRAFT_950259 [Suillus ampliporus]|nr:hypothetical protein DFH29DRAFT_950259 [Suillus ampliporus]
MMTEARTMLQGSKDASEYWKSLGETVWLSGCSFILAASGLMQILQRTLRQRRISRRAFWVWPLRVIGIVWLPYTALSITVNPSENPLWPGMMGSDYFMFVS